MRSIASYGEAVAMSATVCAVLVALAGAFAAMIARTETAAPPATTIAAPIGSDPVATQPVLPKALPPSSLPKPVDVDIDKLLGAQSGN